LCKIKYLYIFNLKHAIRCCAIALCLLASLPVVHANNDFTFAAFGDTPYTEEETARYLALIAEINREKPAFVLHVGDFKSGSTPCTDTLFVQRQTEFALFHAPLIYTPGDNEWSDCWRTFGAARDPLERLQKLRSLFFTGNESLGQQKMSLVRQSATYPEHTRWTHGGVTFITLNVPGGNNNMRMPGEHAAREKMVLNWIETTFAMARTQGQAAVVIVMQANPFLVSLTEKNGYANLLSALIAEASQFKGQVLLVHGDTHRYRFDQPLIDLRTKRPLRNVSRLEVFGFPFVNWVRVRVSQRDGNVAFSVSPGG
jgi:Calcineurin-like phosphoesterase